MIRPFEVKDLPDIQRIHRQMKINYDLPRKFFSLVVTDENDVVEQALLFRPTAEMFYLRDQTKGNPLTRWQKFQMLHEAMRQFALSMGLDEVEALLPPIVESRFGRRLMSLGWQKNLWTCYTRVLEEPYG